VLLEEILFLCDAVESLGDHQDPLSVPRLYLNIEFCQLFIKRDEIKGRKHGFSLMSKDVCHEFIIEDDPSAVKAWLRALNHWVIRTENLKKFVVVQEIGVGGQGKVYKIAPRAKN
jgi:hypothetical protein